MIIQTLCYLLHLIGSLQNALQYLQLEEAIESYSNLKPKFQLHDSHRTLQEYLRTELISVHGLRKAHRKP